MKTIDITFDVETCSLAPTAAVMSIGAVAWDRYGHDLPFIMNDMGGIESTSIFYKHVDMRSQFLDGFTFDSETAQWWARQNDKAKEALLENDETPLMPIKDVVESFFVWIKSTVEAVGAESVCLWSQGTDFDVAILKNICAKYGLEIPVKYQNFRDHRTYVMERGSKALSNEINMLRNIAAEDPRKVYELIKPFDRSLMDAQSHNPVYDCLKSINSTWFMMHKDA